MNDAALRAPARGRGIASGDDESPRPRRVRRPSWFDSRFLAGLALVAMSVLAGARLVSSAGRTGAVVALVHDVAEGTVLRIDDLVVVRGSPALTRPGVYLTRTSDAIGRRTSRALAAGELLPGAAVADLPPLTWLEVPLAQDAAPPLSVGQRITLWLTVDSCAPVVVVADVPVQRVRPAATGAFATATGQAIEIAVAPEAADRVLAALAQTSREHAALRVGILSGADQRDDGTPLPPLECPEQP